MNQNYIQKRSKLDAERKERAKLDEPLIKGEKGSSWRSPETHPVWHNNNLWYAQERKILDTPILINAKYKTQDSVAMYK